MNPEHQLAPDGRSPRADKAVRAATSGNRQPFYGEGMHQGNTVPKPGPTMADPAKGATPPTTKNPMQRPGMGASNPAKRGVL